MKKEASTIIAPASKSVSHRAIIATAMSVGRCKVSGMLESEDLERTCDIMRCCGADIQQTGPGAFDVRGMNGVPTGGPVEPIILDVGESGTTCRLLTAVVAVGMGVFKLQGRGRMHDRPMAELTTVLKDHGVEIDFLEKDGYLPLILKAAGLKGGVAKISLEESSQYLSGLLLGAPIARQPLTIEVVGKKMVSWPYVGLTLQVLTDFGIKFHVETKDDAGNWNEVDWRNPGELQPGKLRFRVIPGMYMARDYSVEGDWSNASYFLAAGAAGPGPVSIKGLRKDSLQGDRVMCDIIEKMGAQVSWDGDTVTAAPPVDGKLKGVTVDMGSCPDIVPTVSVLASMAEGPTTITNVAHLRIKESDRAAAVVQELARVGCKVTDTEDSLRIDPQPLPEPGTVVNFSSHDDHRFAMSMSVYERIGIKAEFDNPKCVAKSFPTFFNVWAQVMK